MTKSFKTSKGTELPLLNLRGNDYLEVKYRLVWFREEHPNWSIETSFVNITDRSACARAEVKDEQGRVIATAHKNESARDFADFMEKAETGAIGRALALIGFGTQFCAEEFDEGDRIVDAPVARHVREDSDGEAVSDEEELELGSNLSKVDPGNFVISFGRKYRGKKLREIPQREIEGYVQWLEKEAVKQRSGMSTSAKLLKKAVELYYATPEVAEVGEAADERQAS